MSRQLSQTARLAKELNRTLVLPNVHLGLLHVCYTTPWSAYYDIEWYEEKFGVHAITFDQYTNWVAAQQLQPTGAYVVAAKERVDNGTIARTFVINSSTLESTCDDKAPLDYSPFPDEIEMKPPRGFDHDEELAEEFGHRLLKELPAFVQHTDDSGLVMEPDVISIVRTLPQQSKSCLHIASHRNGISLFLFGLSVRLQSGSA